MAQDINLSASIRTNLLSLQSTNALFERTSERLSTGLKVNSALDGTSAFFSARSLNNRAGDLAELKDGMGQAIQTLKAADKGIEALTTLVSQAKTIAEQAKEASAQTSKIESSAAASTTNTATTMVTAMFGNTISITNTFIIAVTGAGTTTITFSVTNNVQTILDQITAADTSLTAKYNTTTDKIEIAGEAGTEVTISATSANFGITAGTTTFGSTGSGSSVTDLEADFEKVMTEMNKIYQDAGYKGVNLINGNDLTVTTNENSTTQVISSATLNVTGVGFTAATVSWSTASNIDTSITEAKTALATLRTTSSGFSADLGLLTTREDFTGEIIETLEAGAGLLVNASLEEESANLLALQTRQSLGTSALTFANQVQNSVLQLFR
jgi:flagellin-like hook-associated protein FlgL